MKIRRSENSGSELINMSSLLDVMFILIIFFLATTTFQQEERDIQVKLPQSKQGKALSSVAKVLVVNVRKDGSYLLGSKQVDIDQLNDMLATAVATTPDQKVLVRADRQSLHGHVAAAISSCKRAGIKEANIGYQTEP